MNNTVFKNRYSKIRIFSTITLAVIILIIVQSCGKEDPTQPGSETITAAPGSDGAIAAKVTRTQALARLNECFKNEFSHIAMQQVNGVTKQQFMQWLRNGIMAPAEDIVKPLLETDGIEYLIIKNVTVQANGKKANIGLIATTPNFYSQYTRMVAVIEYTNIIIGQKHICSWKKCDSYSPCPCITWIDYVYGDCPFDRCQFDSDCQHYNPATDCDGELTGIKTYDVIAAF